MAERATGPCKRVLCLFLAACRGPMFSRTYVFSGDMWAWDACNMKNMKSTFKDT